ncbi:hypothetical protein ACFPRL_26585 [Pseudoclavibacter helvolus]
MAWMLLRALIDAPECRRSGISVDHGCKMREGRLHLFTSPTGTRQEAAPPA